MATLIFVHGTFATGPAKGDRWWQEGSPFEAEMRVLIAGRDGPVKFDRVIWDGQNAVSSRRGAGTDLYAKLKALEALSEPYCVIGHSHGGSAIASALMIATLKRQPLDQLQRWITVGTPFVEPEKKRYLFSRLSDFGKAVFAAILTFAVFAILAVLSSPLEDGPVTGVAIVLIALLPAMILLSVLWIANAMRYAHLRPRATAAFDERFMARWFGLWHKNDEAIGGLKTLTRVERPIFSRLFALPLFSALAIFVFPILLYALCASADVAQWVFKFHVDRLGSGALEGIRDAAGVLVDGGTNLGVNFALYVTTSFELANAALGGGKWGSNHQAVYLMVAIPLFFLLLALLIALTVKLIARPISYLASLLLNRWAWGQIRQSGMGGDVEGERAIKVMPFPHGALRQYPALCDALAKDFSDVSDRAAGEAVGKLRNLINEIAFSPEGPDQSLLETCLTWNELIHASYFDHSRFRKLLAYAIARNDGFEATPAFKADADYAFAAACYDELETAANASVAPADP